MENVTVVLITVPPVLDPEAIVSLVPEKESIHKIVTVLMDIMMMVPIMLTVYYVVIDVPDVKEAIATVLSVLNKELVSQNVTVNTE